MAELTEEVVKQIALDSVSAYIKESGMDKTDQKYLVIPDADEKETLSKSTKEKFGQLAKAIAEKDFVTIKANNMGTDSAGGYLVPEETAAEILKLIPTYGQARQYVNVGLYPKNRDIIKLPVQGSNPTVYYPGEGATITASQASFSVLTMEAKKAAAYVELTNELKEFAIVDFVNYLTEQAAVAFAIDEDSKVFGKTNSVFTGLFYPTQTFGVEVPVTSISSIDYDDLLSVIYGIDQNYTANASWFMHRTMVEKLRGLKDTTGMPLLVPSNNNGLPTLLGYPVVMIENGIPTASETTSGQPVILFGNLKNSFLKEKANLTVAVSEDYKFQDDVTAVKFIKHWSFNPGLVSKYGVIQLA